MLQIHTLLIEVFETVVFLLGAVESLGVNMILSASIGYIIDRLSLS